MYILLYLIAVSQENFVIQGIQWQPAEDFQKRVRNKVTKYKQENKSNTYEK